MSPTAAPIATSAPIPRSCPRRMWFVLYVRSENQPASSTRSSMSVETKTTAAAATSEISAIDGSMFGDEISGKADRLLAATVATDSLAFGAHSA